MNIFDLDPGLIVWPVITIVVLAIFVVPWFFFLLNLRSLLERVSDHNRAMPAGHVWLNFIPIFNLGWFIYTVVKVRDSVRAEHETKGWAPEGDLGYNVGVAAGCLLIASFLLWWIPFIGWALGIAYLVCWIIYWLKTSDLKNQLGAVGAGVGAASPPPYSRFAGPASMPYAAPQPYAPPASAPGPVAAPMPPAAPQAPAPAEGSESGQPSGEEGGRTKLCVVCGAPCEERDRFCRVCGSALR